MNSIDNPILNKLYRGTKSIEDFNWDNLTSIPLLYLISREEIDALRRIATSPRYSGNGPLRMKMIKEIMNNRGFTFFAGGTNRLVFEHPMAPNTVFKVGIDKKGVTDNPAEFYNQELLKPYCCKIFECSPCGTIASVEKVDRISNYDEFLDILPDYMALIGKFISGKYVMEDIGINYFLNYGIRRGNSIGSGLVLLDYPYLFELDGRKLVCGIRLENGTICNGEIDWHPTFNYLHCEKCGRIINARDLAKLPEDSGILIREGGSRRMKITVRRGGKVEKVIDTNKISTHFVKEDINNTQVTNRTKLVVKVTRVEVEEEKPSNVLGGPIMRTGVPNANKRVYSDNTVKSIFDATMKVNTDHLMDRIDPEVVKVKVTIGDTNATTQTTVTESANKLVVKPVEDERIVKPKAEELQLDASAIFGIITEKSNVFDPKEFNKPTNDKVDDSIDEDIDEVAAAKYLENEKRTNDLVTNITNAIFGKESEESETGKDINVPGNDDENRAEEIVNTKLSSMGLAFKQKFVDEPIEEKKTTTRKPNHKRPSSTKSIKATRTKKITSEEDAALLKPKKKSEV